MKDSGLELLEIIDNGSGIDASNYETLALKHYTSKLTKFSDIDKLKTFGFRGEALSSLCAISKSVVVTTRTKDEVNSILLHGVFVPTCVFFFHSIICCFESDHRNEARI